MRPLNSGDWEGFFEWIEDMERLSWKKTQEVSKPGEDDMPYMTDRS